MEHAISNTKMNRIPLLPPLVTSDIATEIKYYKQLAFAVQERLKSLEFAQRNSLIEGKDEIKDGIEIAFGKSNNSHFELENNNTVQNKDEKTNEKTESLIDFSSNGNDNTNKMGNSIYENVTSSLNKQEHNSLVEVKPLVNENNSCHLDETLTAESNVSDTITSSTDLNQFLNTSISTKTDTTETTPENWKPQVPKTLDIVPITVNKSRLLDKSNSLEGETPKLVRQGSYVLEAPSPMLLAHMQNEMANADYTPTSMQSIKRKEWNMSQIKGEWETRSNFKEPVNSIRPNATTKYKRNNTKILSQRLSKSVSNSKTGSPLDIYQPAKSVDCIQAMFAKECYSPKTSRTARSCNQSYKYSSTGNGENSIRNNNTKKVTKTTTSVMNLANKSSSSLGSLSNAASPKPIRSTGKRNDLNSNPSKISNGNSVKNIDNNNSAIKSKPVVITSEKIVTVFKEIQDTHKKQMIELITSQQKEQLLMQENFKRQQILLLAQIRKAFPEMSISALSEAISGKNIDHTTPVNLTTTSDQQGFSQKDKDINNSQINGIHPVEKLHQMDAKSLTEHPPPYDQNNCRVDQTFDSSSPMLMGRPQASNVIDIDNIPVGNPNRRHSNVSKQLFPLDSQKASHIPVFDNSMYTEKHIKAATIISAHAKGFLVRRLMTTEKVIALKNTYREALHCMLKLHVDAPLNLPELNFHQRLQLQCDAASMNIVDLFSASPVKRMEIIAHDREVKKARAERPSSARSYSFATQRTLARKKLKEMGVCPGLQSSMMSRSCPARTRCQTWTSNTKERKNTTSMIYQGIKRSTSAHAVRKPWR